MVKRIAVYAGTFDPITNGHIDLLKRALKMFDSVIIAITTNPKKTPLFSLEERVALAKASVKGIKRVKVESFSGLLVNYLKKKKAHTILRGLRALSEFEYEFQQALMNRKMFPEADTVFIMTSPKYFYVSSSMVKEIALLGGSLCECVPAPVDKALKAKFSKKGK
ncbi:MAG: pantetheine-phosphate adenylyltransferase [Candidatus Diapherotrites archaeon]|nr:pantetheine-phosphate adenylyltransferase [Candidatus Diapherotrites archaeon]